MTDPASLVVIGTGGLARAITYALAVISHPIRVTVVGRDPTKAAEICYVSSTRAAVSGTSAEFHPVAVDLARADALTDALAAAAPDGVLLAASSQSPWEARTSPSAWTALVQHAGFGLTLPFQADSALRVGRALAATGTDAWFVNACFPDAVNPVLSASGVPVLCGVGNAGLLAASLQAALGLPDQRDLRVLAHHVHLYTPSSPEDEALAWHGDRPLTRVSTLLAAQRAAGRAELNHVTGLTAARLLSGLLSGAEIDTNLPGPLGLPGGYPVRLSPGRLDLRLPPGVDRAEAVAFNQRAALRDGVVVDGGRVTFGPAAQEQLARPAPELADGFPVADLAPAGEVLGRLRERLRDLAPEQSLHPVTRT
ncbi:hypothetical protein SAMN05421874_11523 [Nonomuraea maritima]|uniref:Saccharopine dehydrogenase NADP binding domain-containing protein n=1 Tax=Nonomuraea maritima TaxID=683260 RepID=A0A1G9GYW2_9ACTN|nr:hypothetical protein [Nonomuraea maritima]SDL05920.1 hypothetical protein SAMN05421874_11523 [Nonomuraea maritima]